MESATPDSTDASQRNEFQQFLLHAVLHPGREAGQRSDFLFVEDSAEFSHRVEQPLGLVRHRSHVPWPKNVGFRKPSWRLINSSFSRKSRTSRIFPWMV